MYVIEGSPSDTSKVEAVVAARLAIWRLFQEGYVDEDMATAGLLAVDLGTRRAERHANGGAASTDASVDADRDPF
jgi:hypothetical protein